MSIETEIQTEVDTLKQRFSDTKALYREVCALLFFRFGITPTTSKLYQFVRKGSMSAPADALNLFWEELRSKASVEIDHPDLPSELAKTAADAIAEIWRQATAAARGELAALRSEVAEQIQAATIQLEASKAACEGEQRSHGETKSKLAAGEAALRGQQVEIEAERRAHGASVARLEELQRHFDSSKKDLERAQAAFSRDLAEARQAVEAANERADAAERRSMLEIDQERQARLKADRQAQELRTQLTALESRRRDEEVASLAELTRVKSDLENALRANRQAQEEKAALEHDASTAIEQAAEVTRQLAQARTEAQTLRDVIERVAPAPAKAGSKPRRRLTDSAAGK